MGRLFFDLSAKLGVWRVGLNRIGTKCGERKGFVGFSIGRHRNDAEEEEEGEGQ